MHTLQIVVMILQLIYGVAVFLGKVEYNTKEPFDKFMTGFSHILIALLLIKYL